jgi:thymidylate synthase
MDKFKTLNTTDILELFKYKYYTNDFRIVNNAKQQSRTLEIQGAHFIVDKPWIVREPNYEYAKHEIDWYMSMSLNVNDIEGGAPKMWLKCSTSDGRINSNYGWCIFSKENASQYENCMNRLIEDTHTREACMIYNRPSMQYEYNKDNMHDFMCTYSVQCFLNDIDNDSMGLAYHVFMRSNDAVFGFNNDALWHKFVQERLAKDLSERLGKNIICESITWNAGSLHIYERHFKYLDQQA